MRKSFMIAIAVSMLLLTGCTSKADLQPKVAEMDIVELQNKAAIFEAVPAAEEWKTEFELPAVTFPITETDYKNSIYGSTETSTIFSLSLQEGFIDTYIAELSSTGWETVSELGEYPEQNITLEKKDSEFEYVLNISTSAAFYYAADKQTYNVTALHASKTYL